MAYKNQKKLEEFSAIYISYLNYLGFKSEVEMYRDYMVKIKVLSNGEGIGFVKCYYSSKNNETTVKFDELTIDFNPIISFEEFKKREIYDLKEEKIIKTRKNNNISTSITEVLQKDDLSKCEEENIYKAYTDGSYQNGNYGYGIVILENDKIKARIFGKTVNDFEGNNVVAEVFGVRRALHYCLNKNIKEINIYYDLKNLEEWAKDRWKTNAPLSKEYKNFIQNLNININWHKVKAHSGEKNNELADKLAKEGTKI